MKLKALWIVLALAACSKPAPPAKAPPPRPAVIPSGEGLDPVLAAALTLCDDQGARGPQMAAFAAQHHLTAWTAADLAALPPQFIAAPSRGSQVPALLINLHTDAAAGWWLDAARKTALVYREATPPHMKVRGEPVPPARRRACQVGGDAADAWPLLHRAWTLTPGQPVRAAGREGLTLVLSSGAKGAPTGGVTTAPEAPFNLMLHFETPLRLPGQDREHAAWNASDPAVKPAVSRPAAFTYKVGTPLTP